MRRLSFITVVSLLLVFGASITLSQKRVTRTPRSKRMTSSETSSEVRLITLAPGHFHAALVQKVMYPDVSPTVWVYAPAGPDLDEHLKRVAGYNNRSEHPTNWDEKLYTGEDFFAKMLAEQRREGDERRSVVVIAGNNREKTDYILGSLNAGFHVLADKPMCIDAADFEKLRMSFKTAAQNDLLLYDVMTERYEITTMLQKALVNDPAVFGHLVKGSMDHPAVIKESVHHLFKNVSGKPLRRPAWFFDTAQQGEGIVDITTHLVDLIQWESFPEQAIALSDIKMLRARRWPTIVTREQFAQVTGLTEFPDYLRGQLSADGALPDFSNGELSYTLKGIHARVSVIWNFAAPLGAGDTHFSIMRGTKANVVIQQGSAENYRPELYVEAGDRMTRKSRESQRLLEAALQKAVKKLQAVYPGLELRREESRWHIHIPDEHRTDHEAHFGQVMEKFLTFLKEGKLPAWEVPNMIAKYYTTIKALELAQRCKANC